MLLANSLFDTTSYAHRTLFSDSQPVWSALNDLRGYMDGCQYQAEIMKSISDGVPLQKAAVLYELNEPVVGFA